MITSEWKERGNCWSESGALHDLFFPSDSYERKWERDRRRELVAELCETCPVSVQCREYAERFEMHFGIWAGHHGEDIQRHRRLRMDRQRRLLEPRDVAV